VQREKVYRGLPQVVTEKAETKQEPNILFA
jgi:hypothetical protein